MDEKMDTKQRLIRFFEIASLVCSHCGKLGILKDKSCHAEITRNPEYYGIHTIDDWDRKMDEEMQWISSSKQEILEILPEIGDEWKVCKQTIKQLFEEK